MRSRFQLQVLTEETSESEAEAHATHEDQVKWIFKINRNRSKLVLYKAIMAPLYTSDSISFRFRILKCIASRMLTVAEK